jgi:DUF4097 and DUF4098 domain-containing protein YvlB
MNRSALMTAACCCALVSGVPGARAAAIDQQVAADPHGSVEITDTEGVITCIGWDQAQVAVRGELGPGAERVDVERSGNTVTVKVVRLVSSAVLSGSTRLEVQLPAASTLHVQAVNASVSVRGFIGEQHLQTVSGEVQTEAAGADLDLKTVSGAIRVHGNNSRVHVSLNTVNGKTHLSNVSGDIDADTVSGDFEATQSALGRVRIKAISAAVILGGRLNPDAHVELSSITGNSQLHWSNAEDANIQIETLGGEVHTCFANNPPVNGPGSSWRNVKAGAAAEVHVRSLSGSAEICNK